MGIRSLEGTSNPRTRSVEILFGWVPGDTRVVPGYGPLTSLRKELQKNAHLQKLVKMGGIRRHAGDEED